MIPGFSTATQTPPPVATPKLVATGNTFSHLIEVVNKIQKACPDPSFETLIDEMEKKREELITSTALLEVLPKKRTEDERTYDHYWSLFFQAVLNKFGKDTSQRDQFPKALFYECQLGDLVFKMAVF